MFPCHLAFGCKAPVSRYCTDSCRQGNTQGASAWIAFVFKILKIPWASSLAGSRNVSQDWVAPEKMGFGMRFSPKYFMTLLIGSSHLHLD